MGVPPDVPPLQEMDDASMQLQIRTLIVDDNDDIRLLLRLIIQAANNGMSVVGEASDGAEAIASIADLDPTVVVLDHMMPGMTGLECARQIKADRPGQAIIICSAYVDDVVRAHAKEMGIEAVVPKRALADLPDIVRAIATSR
jgi:DNA-binding NarL/FixJ family response regulator